MADRKHHEIVRDLREMSDEELHEEIARQRGSLYDFRRKHAMRQLTNTVAIRMARKQIARSLTILKERKLNAERGPGRDV